MHDRLACARRPCRLPRARHALRFDEGAPVALVDAQFSVVQIELEVGIVLADLHRVEHEDPETLVAPHALLDLRGLHSERRLACPVGRLLVLRGEYDQAGARRLQATVPALKPGGVTHTWRHQLAHGPPICVLLHHVIVLERVHRVLRRKRNLKPPHRRRRSFWLKLVLLASVRQLSPRRQQSRNLEGVEVLHQQGKCFLAAAAASKCCICERRGGTDSGGDHDEQGGRVEVARSRGAR